MKRPELVIVLDKLQEENDKLKNEIIEARKQLCSTLCWNVARLLEHYAITTHQDRQG